MPAQEMTATADHALRRVEASVEQRGQLWQDPGGRRLRTVHVDPYLDTLSELVAALRRRDEALAQVGAVVAEIRHQVELFRAAERRCHEDLDRYDEAMRSLAEAVDELFNADAAAAEEEAAAIQAIEEAERLLGVVDDGTGARWGRHPDPQVDRRYRAAELRWLQRRHPAINVRHVLEGEINGQHNLTGGHSILSRLTELAEHGRTDDRGVRQAQARTAPGHEVAVKQTTHTAFPGHWTSDRTLAEIAGARAAAWEPGTPGGLWQGRSPSGIVIAGRVRNGQVLAHPLFGEVSDARS